MTQNSPPAQQPQPQLESRKNNRKIEFEGAFNARDLGGLLTQDDRVVRSNMLFRSDSPQLLSERDVAHLVEDLGLRTVLDLRYADESATEGIGGLATPSVVHRNIPVRSADLSVAPGLRGDLPEAGSPFWMFTFSFYKGYFSTADGAALTEAVRALAEADALPALVHCAAGKDRTGVVIALVLAAIGVPEEQIAADYAASAEAVPAIMKRLASLASYGNAGSTPAEHQITHPETMAALLDWVRSEHGSVRDWLIARGVTDAELAALRERLTEPRQKAEVVGDPAGELDRDNE